MVDIVDRIANGEAQLLGSEDICTRLGISRTTFDRWVRNGGGKASGTVPLAEFVVGQIVGKNVMDQLHQIESKNEGSIKFPPPDIRIGNSPKWEMQTFKQWLRDNTQPGK